MKPQKPITDKMKERANAMYLLLKQGGFWTKEQLGERLGIKNERTVRDVISALSKRVPIISTSDNKGYALAMSEKDLEYVIHTWKEHDSRQQELEERKKPLIKFYEKYKNNCWQTKLTGVICKSNQEKMVATSCC